ncbi:site-specific integrase [Synechocystis sp. LKSZ1]|uniref:site-specific integrase n=1 Tax=Synechocystis sp. LKSZ1 TaxID=3144951 RepID=UPI00336BE9F9
MGKLDVSGRLNQANGQLRAGKTGVTITQRGDRLYLVATLPPKPGSEKTYPHQQRIALGFRANPAGIDQAVLAARELSLKLTRGEFTWEAEAGPLVVRDWIERLKAQYLLKRIEEGADRAKAQETWESEYIKAFKALDWDAALTLEALEKGLKSCTPNSRTRRRRALAFAGLADLAGLAHDLRKKTGSYGPKAVNPRDVPTDEEIAQWWGQIPNPEWQCAYALQACYGLRNYEVFRLDLSDFPVAFVHKGKTNQERYVYPLYPEWAERWLVEIKLPQVNGKNTDLGNRVTHQFSRYGIPFNPYDLRHAWARRSLEFGWDLSLAAAQMGHSVKVHADIYHAWITRDTYQRAYETLLSNPDRPLAP